ncbi:MAG: transporter, iron chelate uptake transporter (FeCT) family, periplasmic substrate-binding, partial [Acidobacteriaceae bacterium]|nr:transporter, iron chelate uptake transporter (FeCT) family, periplasmic substrate-binding [Acidobacteriaceae bacterium]
MEQVTSYPGNGTPALTPSSPPGSKASSSAPLAANPSAPCLRIAALQPSISIILDQLGALDSLVACTKYCVEAVPALADRPITIIKDSWSCTTEEILAAQPSLVLACVPYRMDSLAALLKAGCPVVTLAPRTLADIDADIRLLGS